MRPFRMQLVALAVFISACSGATATATTARPAPATSTTQAATSTAAPATTLEPTTTLPATADWQAVADEYADDLASDMALGGAIVAIWRDGALHVAAAGDQPDGSAIPPGGSWRIGSVTKPFVSAIVLGLVDAGLVDLDEPAATYLRDPAVPESVTVRDLLGHTSGIFNYTDDISFLPQSFADLERVWDPAAVAEGALALREVPPNPSWSYSNTNYILLGLLVEAVTGRSVADELLDLFATAGLEATYLAGAEPGPGPDPVAAYTYFPASPTPVDATFPYTSTATGAWTAGALVSDAADLAGFFRALFSGAIVSTAALDEMTTVGEEDYGLGIARIPGVRDTVYGHSGGIVGYVTNVAYAPEADVAVIVGITSDRPPSGLGRVLQELLVAALAG